MASVGAKDLLVIVFNSAGLVYINTDVYIVPNNDYGNVETYGRYNNGTVWDKGSRILNSTIDLYSIGGSFFNWINANETYALRYNSTCKTTTTRIYGYMVCSNSVNYTLDYLSDNDTIFQS